MTQPIYRHGTVLKTLPDSFTKANDGLWAYATVEVVDADRDIVRVGGIDLSMHRPESPIKVFGTTHKYSPLADGTPPIMGLVKEFSKTQAEVSGKNVPALAFRMEWAKESDGAVTPFASKFKSLYDAGTMDSFSIGFTPLAVKPLKGGRFDVEKSRPFEISASSLPTNPYACIIKSIHDALGEDFDAAEYMEQRLIELQRSTDRLSDLLKSIPSRLDDIECAIVDKAEGPAKQPVNRRSSQLDLSELQAALQRVLSIKT